MNSPTRTLKQCVVAAIVSMLVAAPSLSDDIDVYVAPPPEATVGETLVVFTLDVRPNVMASTVCTGGECDALFTEVGMGDALDGSISFFELLVAALKKVLRGVDSQKVKVALMIPHDDTITGSSSCVGSSGGSDPTCSNGAYVLSAFKSTVQDDPDTPDVNEGEELDEFFEKMESIPLKDGGNWSHQYQLKELFFEMFRYISAGRVYNGRNGLDDFGTGNVNDCNLDYHGDTESVYAPHNESFADGYTCSAETESPDDPNDDDDGPTEVTNPIPELRWDLGAQKTEDNVNFYQNTLDTAEHCTDIFSVNVTFANAQSDHDSDEAIAADFGFDPDNNQQGRLDVLRHLAETDLSPDPESDTDSGLVGNQNIRSYFITRKGGRAVSTANEWADAGGTGFAVTYEDDPDELVRLLSGLFNEIEGVSTTFVSASVPANVFNRAETLNEVFLAIFEPDGTNFELNEDGNFTGGGPFWVGNVKKLTTKITDAEVCNDENGDGDVEDEGECVPRIVCNDENEDGVIDEAEECRVAQEKILVDVLEADKDDPNSAINPLDGRIRAGALTFWTRTGTDNEYLPAPSGTQEEIEEQEKEFTEGTDGRKVSRGGAGQVKPGFLPESGYSPGENNTTDPTTIGGPRKVFTEPDNGTDGTSDPMVALDADESFNTAVELLSDTRELPGSNLEYGEHLYQTVMADCSDCASSYNAESSGGNQNTAEERVNNLIRWARGLDVDLDTDMSTTPPKRDWWQGDPLHSRPLALNYGARAGFTEERPDIRVIVAGNDGMVQMIRDGRKSDGSEDGVEAWSFLPREFVSLQKRLLQGTLGLYNPGQPADSPRIPLHPYAMDGSPSALVVDNNLDGNIDTSAGDRVYLYLGQRRGGKRYYALDLSDPDDPKYLWSIGKNDADGEFDEMGQSWSLMRAGIMRIDEGTSSSPNIKRRPVLVFSGGYNGDDGGDGFGDLGKDSRVKNLPGSDGTMGTDDDEILGTADTEGNALFIVNALTGELIWKVVGPSPDNTQSDGIYDSVDRTLKEDDLLDSVAASPTALDTDGNGLLDRVYFADTGGNVWRVDAAVADRNGWTVNKLFAGGRHVTGFDDNANDRRFFSPPDVVFASDADGEFDAVILGSGDRAHPLGNVVENWLYMIKDRATTSGDPSTTPLTHNDLADLTENCLQSDPNNFGGCTRDSSASTNITNGWKIQLENCEAGGVDDKCGEKTLASALTVEGEISLTTYLPVLGNASTTTIPDTCGPKEGSGLFYVLDLQTAAGVFTSDDGSTTTSDSPRFDRLDSPGIPPDVVQISPKEQLRPDLKIHETKGRESSDTFWYSRKFE